MNKASDLTTEKVFELAPDAKAAQSGMQLVQQGKFSQLQVSPDRTKLAALCQGSEPVPYRVGVNFAFVHPSSTSIADCNCPSFPRPCKHVLGLMLHYIQSRDKFTEGELTGPTKGILLIAGGRRKEPVSPKAVAQAKWDKDTASFLSQILATPDDDTPRLIFADWLEEHGETDRATFIRVQCELARLADDDPRLASLQRQEASLWKKHKKEWLAPLPVWLRRMKPEFGRGFLERITVSANLFLRYVNAMLEAAPIRGVHITNIGGRAPLLAACPQVAKLAEIDFSGQITSQTMKVLLNTPFLKELRTLILSLNPLGLAGIRVLTSVPFLLGLKHLALMGTELGPAAIRLLAEWPSLRQLQLLELSGNKLGNEGARALAESNHASPELVVMVEGCQIGPAGQRALRERFGERVTFH